MNVSGVPERNVLESLRNVSVSLKKVLESFEEVSYGIYGNDPKSFGGEKKGSRMF